LLTGILPAEKLKTLYELATDAAPMVKYQGAVMGIDKEPLRESTLSTQYVFNQMHRVIEQWKKTM